MQNAHHKPKPRAWAPKTAFHGALLKAAGIIMHSPGCSTHTNSLGVMMIIHGLRNAAATYAASAPAASKQKPLDSFGLTEARTASAQLTLSEQARSLAASDSSNSQARLEAIRAKPEAARTADDIDHLQKTGGLVNTMAKLSPSEKKLYDELVAQGNTEAVRGMNLLALSRMGSGDVTLPDGRTFDPNKTEVTPQNIRQLFSQMFVSTDGEDARSFEALASYLDSQKSQAVA